MTEKISIGNNTVREELMKNHTRVWRNIFIIPRVLFENKCYFLLSNILINFRHYCMV